MIKKMILKIVWNKQDKCEDVFEISNYYAENMYLEASLGKNKVALDREMIVSEGEVWINVKPDADNGEDYWEEVIILTDGGVELWKTENLDIELVKQEKEVVEAI